MAAVPAYALDYAPYDAAEAHKLLSENRALYLIQSENTVAGRAAPFPSPSAVPSTSLPALADGLSSSDEKE